MNRQFPGFLVDRSRRKDPNIDFVVCADSECGFIASVQQIKRPQYAEFDMIVKSDYTYAMIKTQDRAIVLHVETWLHSSTVNKPKAIRLIRKAIKYYAEGEIESCVGESDLDMQIKAIEEVLRLAISQNKDRDEPINKLLSLLSDSINSLVQLKSMLTQFERLKS